VTAARQKTNLGAPTTPFVGRDDELADLHDQLKRSRLVSVLGPPGAGKTRLATEYALRYGSAFSSEGAGGVWFCDLSEARDLDDVVRALAHALDLALTDEHTEKKAVERIAAALAARGPTLLVLDNFEQLVPLAVPALENLLRRAAEVSAIVTSRVRLDVNGELVHEVGGLELPSSERGFECDAVRLFLDRARAARSDFQPSAEERAIVAELVTRLDGLPLAIELAGARMGVLGPKQLLDRLGKSLDLLRGGKGRSQTLRATIDWSWNLLEAHEQRALAQASTFHGGFSLEAAEAVIDLGGGSDVLDVLGSLRDSSLLRTQATLELSGEVRFGLLDIVRAYAEEKLEASGEAGAARARHAGYFVEAGTRWANRVERSDGPEHLRRLAVELPNLMAVHRRALATEAPSPTALSNALAVTLALEHVFYMRGPTAPCLVMLDQVFEEVLDGVEPRLLALGLKARGRALRDLGHADESLEAFERALEIARRASDRSTEARVLGHVAFTRMRMGEDEAALELLDEATRTAHDAGDRRSEGMLLASVGIVRVRLGRLDDAARAFDAALAIDEEVGNRYGRAAALAARGELHRACGRSEAARSDLEAALEGYREFGERRHEGIAHTELGVLYQEQKRFADARACLERAQEQHREMGSRMFQAVALLTLGDLEREEGRLPEARARYDRALRIARELGDRVLQARCLASLGGTHASLDRADAARESLQDAERLARALGDPSAIRVVDLERAHLDLREASQAAARGEREVAATFEQSARERLERARSVGPLPTRPAPERLAFRLLEHVLTDGPPPPSRELTPSGSAPRSELGRYELLTEIASGGMATVYVGRQRGAGGFDRLVAVKRMHRHLASVPNLAAAFMDEARIASLVHHPNVVGVQDVHEHKGEHLLVMDYVDGTSLAALMTRAAEAKRAIPHPVAAYVVAQALRGLHAAHEQVDVDGAALGIVHRDATPHNILLGADGSVHITDFGVAKLHQQRTATQDGTAKGKFRYMAPEQVRGEPLDRRVDVFALGVVAWELITGRRLFEGESDVVVVARLSQGEYPRPTSIDPKLDPELAAIVERALAKGREQRFPTALAFAEALEGWAQESGVAAREPDVARVVEELCGGELARRRRAVSEALASARTSGRSLPPPPSSPSSADSATRHLSAISVGESGRWFELPGAARVSLQRRRALRLILKALLEKRLAAPDAALDQQALLEAGWPGERVKHEAGTLRVYNALSTLRKLGLRSVLLSRDDGYLLDPKAEFLAVREHEAT